MCRFIETICIKDGCSCHLQLHNQRLNKTLKANGGKLKEPVALQDYIHSEEFKKRTKCHVDYDANGIERITYTDYHPRLVRSLRILHADKLDYRFKYADRQQLDHLYEQRDGADDVLIVKNNLLTDTTIANVALFDGKRWLTPAHPLLEGTKRCLLLSEGVLVEKDIPVDDIFSYKSICMLNAMLDFHEMEFDITPATIIHL